MEQLNRRIPAADMAGKLTVFAIPLVLIIGLVALKLASWRLYWRVAAVEDGPVEYLTGAVYLGACFVALLASKEFFQTERSLLGALYAVLAAGCFFVAMEEISWGQRILGIDTPPALEEINHQGELNLHNIAGRWKLHAVYIFVGACGAFAWLLVPRNIETRFRGIVDYVVPPWWLMLYFLPTFLLYTYYDYLSPVLVGAFGEAWGWDSREGGGRFMISKDQEPVEFIMSLGFLCFVAYTRKRQLRSKPGDPSQRTPRAIKANVSQPAPV